MVTGEQRASDEFWINVTEFHRAGYHYESLAAITADAHLVVRGRVVDVVRGGRIRSADNERWMDVTFGVVQVDEVLRGVPQSQEPGLILVNGLWPTGDFEGSPPDDEVILFLKNYAQMRIDEAFAPVDDPDDVFYYGKANGFQSIVINRNDEVSVVLGPDAWDYGLSPFPGVLVGRDFQDVTGEIRAVDATPGEAP